MAQPKVDGIRVLAKHETFSAGYSIKDRIIRHIFNSAEARGALRPGMTVVASSSGNTGAAAALHGAVRGYKVIIITNDKCSKEKMDSIRAYGAELLVCPSGLPPDHPNHYMNKAAALAEREDVFDVDQYANGSNPEAHYRSLGPEIWEQTGGTVTHFVAGGSTGGTISGVSRFLKEQNPNIKAVLADPVGSVWTPFIKEGRDVEEESFLVEGVGKDSIPPTLSHSLVDDCIVVSDADSFTMCHRLARQEGLLGGGSCGLNMSAAVRLANSLEEPATIVTVLPDSGIKYLSKIYNDEWLEAHQLPTSTRVEAIIAAERTPERQVSNAVLEFDREQQERAAGAAPRQPPATAEAAESEELEAELRRAVEAKLQEMLQSEPGLRSERLRQVLHAVSDA